MSHPGSDWQQVGQQLMTRCETLAAISDLPGAVSRAYLTPEHKACNNLVADWFNKLGMQSWQDQAGNIWGRLPGRSTATGADEALPSLLIGSHLDSVPNGGKYDGILGVLVGIEACSYIEAGTLPFHIDIVGFGDEEGTRFGTTLLGSRAVAGQWHPDWLNLEDKQGISLAKALETFGCVPSRISECRIQPQSVLAYLEVHIEQGPQLEAAHQPLGVVSSIAGARRFEITISGKAGHAGTVPMAMRQDALVAAANAIYEIEAIAKRFQIVATVGQLQCYPGAPNVIPGECRFSLDIRAGRDKTRDTAIDAIQQAIDQLCDTRRLKASWRNTHCAAAVECTSWLQRLLEDVLLDMDLEPMSLVSGAGHDAMSLADMVDIGMLFVRCKDGISHHPDEAITTEDAGYAVEALRHTVAKLAEKFERTTA